MSEQPWDPCEQSMSTVSGGYKSLPGGICEANPSLNTQLTHSLCVILFFHKPTNLKTHSFEGTISFQASELNA